MGQRAQREIGFGQRAARCSCLGVWELLPGKNCQLRGGAAVPHIGERGADRLGAREQGSIIMSLYGESDGREPYRRVDEALRTIAKTLHPRTPLFYTVVETDEDFDARTVVRLFGHVSKLADSLRPIVNAEERFAAIVANPGDGYAAALCAVLLCGCAFIPIDREWSEERRRRVLEHANPAAIVFVGPRPSLKRMARWRGRLIDAPEHVPEVTRAQTSPELPEPPPWAEDALYVMYTSGSTGEPKAVVGTHEDSWPGAMGSRGSDEDESHESLPPEEDEGEESGEGEESELEDAKESLDYTCGCLHTRVGFVDSVTETLCPLLQGASSMVPQEFNPGGIQATMVFGEVTHFSAVPSLWERLNDEYLGEINLKTAVCSGEPMPVPLMNRIIRNLDHERFRHEFTFINLYGSTEVAGDATELQIKQRLIPSEVEVEYQDERQYELVYRNKSSQLVPLDRSLAFVPAGFDLPFAQTIIVKREGEGEDEKFIREGGWRGRRGCGSGSRSRQWIPRRRWRDSRIRL